MCVCVALSAEVPEHLQAVWGRTGLHAPPFSLKVVYLHMVGFLEMFIEGMNKLLTSADIYFKTEQNKNIMIQNSCPLGPLEPWMAFVSDHHGVCLGLCRVLKTWGWRGKKKKHPSIRVPGLSLRLRKKTGGRIQLTWGKFISLFRFTVLL